MTLTAVVGQIVLLRFEYQGVYVEPTDTTAFSTPTVGQEPLPFLSSGLALHGIGSLKAENLTINLQNQLSPRMDATKAAGVLSYVITDRNPVGELDPEAELVSVINYPNRITANTTGALTWNLTGSAGNIVTVTCPNTQIVAAPMADRNSISTRSLSLEFKKNSDAGDDEVQLVFT